MMPGHIKIASGAAFAVALLATAPALHAADLQGNYAAEGPGTQNCAAFLELDPASDDYILTAGYVSGYLGAANALQAETYDLTPWQTLELSIAQIRQFCTANPAARFAQALAQYSTFLMPQRITDQEEKISLQVGDQVVVHYRTTVEQIRAALRDKGFGTDDEPLSGLKEFQSSAGLEPTGLPDQVTLAMLLGGAR